MKLIPLLMMTASLLGAAEVERAAKIRIPGKMLPIIRADIKIDGQTRDWKAVPFQDSLEYKIPRFAPVTNAADASVRFKAAADEKNLYFLVLVRDNKIVTKPPFSHESDSVEIYLSTSLRKGKKTPGDIQIIISPEKQKFHFSGSMNFWKNMQLQIKPVKIKGGWGFEAAVPLKNDLWNITPYDGLKMGFSMHYNDNDTGVRNHKIAWYPDPQEISWCSNDPMGRLTFVWDPKAPKIPVKVFSEVNKKKAEFSIINTRPGSLNILVNGNFANGDEGYSIWMPGCTYQVRKENGKHFMEIDGSKFPYGKHNNFLCTHMFHVFPKEKYLFRFNARIRNGKNHLARVGLSLKDENYHVSGCGSVLISPNWKKKEIEFLIPARYIEHNSEVHLMIWSKDIGGGIIDISDVELVRFVPDKIDAAFRFPQQPFCFLFDSGAKKTAELELKNFGTVRQTVKAAFEIRDVYSGEKVKGFNAVYQLKPGEDLKIQIPCETGRNGGFSLTGLFTDSNGKTFRRVIEYAVAQRVREQAQLGAICICNDTYLKDGSEKIAQLSRRLGFKSMRMFVCNITPGADGVCDYTSMDHVVNGLKKVNMEAIASIPIGKSGTRFPEFEVENFAKNVRAFVRHFRGRIKYYEIGNECNLPEGWRPEPNAREYSMLLRAAFAVIRSEDPAAQVLNCGFSGAANNAYTQEFLTFNKGNFYDAVAIHPYSVRGRSMDTRICSEGVANIAKYHPQGRVIDTESGTDHLGFKEQVACLSRKLPALLFIGIERHHDWGIDRTRSGYFFSPHSSPSPAIATYAFLNNFYPARCKNVGCWELGENFNGMISELNGTLRGAFWRELPGNRDLLTIPVEKNAKVFDVFGNEITKQCTRKGNQLVLNLPKENAVFVQGILPPAKQIRKRPASVPGSLYVPCNTEVLLLPEYVQGFFRQELVPGQKETLHLNVFNFGKKNRKVKLYAKMPKGIQCKLNHTEFSLKAGEKKKIELKFSGFSGKGKLEICGTADGQNMASLPIDVAVCGELLCQVSGRHVKIRNLMDRDIRGTIYFSSKVLDVIPYKKKNIALAPKQEKIFAFEIMPIQQKYPPKGLASSTATFVEENSGKSWKQNLLFPVIRITPGEPLPQDNGKWFDSWGKEGITLSMQGTPFNAAVKCRMKHGKLYCAIRVHDDHHFQKQGKGEIGNGDSVIIGIDPADSTKTASGYEKGTFEAGFALRNDGGIEKYYWNGTFGLESVRPFPKAEARIFRHGSFTDYELTIPLNLPSGTNHFSLGIKVNDRMANGKLRSLQFGSGLNDVRSARDFGTAVVE